MRNLLLILVFSSIIGCGGSSSSNGAVDNGKINKSPPNSNSNLPIPNNTLSANYKVLLVGNSHVSANNLSGIIKTLIEHGKPQHGIQVSNVGGTEFLDGRINDGKTLERIESDSWTHVILQGQKYSQSGAKLYATDATETWISVVKEQQATPILFPEHAKYGNQNEAQYVHDIHLSIIEKQSSCIAPIGLGWDKVITEMPQLVLHSPDGNHAAYTGSFFTALIFYQVITGELADALPYIGAVPLSEDIQDRLGIFASQILDEHQACDY